MPIPLRDSASSSLNTIAWLRFADHQESRCLCAGLLETSTNRSPLEFGFAHVGTQDPSSPLYHISRPQLIASLARSLFLASRTSPALVVLVGDDLPSQGLEGLTVDLPMCRVSGIMLDSSPCTSTENPNCPDQSIAWIPNPPPKGSDAEKVWRKMLTFNNPFEPLNCVIRAMAETFADQKLDRFDGGPNSSTVVTLPSIRDHERLRMALTIDDEPAVSKSHAIDESLTNSNVQYQFLQNLDTLETQTASRSIQTELHWAETLLPFQLDGIATLIQMNRLLLSDDMGLGKTIQVVAAIRILRILGEIKSCLVVAPAGLLDQWRQEFDKWAPELAVIIIRGVRTDRSWQWKADTEVKLVSYDTLRSDIKVVTSHDSGASSWDVVVLDEAQRIKNRITTSKVAKSIPRLRSWALTGTPIENHEGELASIMEFVDHYPGQDPKRYWPGERLRSRHRELQLRRKKSEVLKDLPPKLTTRLSVQLHGMQRLSYNKAEAEGVVFLQSLGTTVEIRHILELITRLKQICNFDPVTGDSSKLEDMRERLPVLSAQGHKALIFSQYKSDVSGVGAIAHFLREFNPLTLTGDHSPQQRSEIISEFRKSEVHRILVISLRAGSLGLNLQEASYVFHMDRWWNPAIERQAEDRSHRMGQTVKVNAIKYMCVDTIEERIDEILRQKQHLFDSLIDDVSMDLSKSLTKAELLSLFNLNQ